MIYLLITWLAAPILWIRLVLKKARGERRRILIIQTAKIGDFVMTTPIYRALRLQLPQAEITALLHPVNLPLAEGLNSIDRLISLPPGGFKGWQGKLWLLKELRQGYTDVLTLSPNLSTFLLPFWASIPSRVSVLPDRKKGIARLAWCFLSYGEKHQPGRLFRETALRSLSGLGIDVDNELLNLPNEIDKSAGRNSNIFSKVSQLPRPVIGLALGSGNRMKAMASASLYEISHRIIEETPAYLILTGTQEDQEVAEQLKKKLPKERVFDSTGRCKLNELPALLSLLDCFVGVDSGATYLADAVGTPVIDFMGPANASDQQPIGTRAIIIHSKESCAPCSHAFDAPYKCYRGTRSCMTCAPVNVIVDKTIKTLKDDNEK